MNMMSRAIFHFKDSSVCTLLLFFKFILITRLVLDDIFLKLT